MDLLPFTNRLFCRVRQYKNTCRQVGTVIHVAYLGQSILEIKNVAWMSILGELYTRNESRVHVHI